MKPESSGDDTTAVRPDAAPLRPTTRTATMEDVARAVGVSKMTVSYALSGKRRIAPTTRDAILRAADALGFAPNSAAQSLSSGRNNRSICLYTRYLNLGVDTLKIRLLQEALRRQGNEVSFHSSGGDRETELSTLANLRRQRPRMLLCATADLGEDALTELRRYQEEGGILVCYDFPVELDCDWVGFDHEDAAYVGTRHLLERGHRRIGLHILGPQYVPDALFAVQTRAGFFRALAEAGIADVPEAYLIRGLSYDDFEGGGVYTAERLLDMPPAERPTALFVVNDSAAMALISRLLRGGIRVPEDISIVSEDDLPLARYCTVPLTTIAHPVEVIVQRIGALAESRLTGAYTGPARREVVHGPLIERASVAPPSDLLR